MIMIPMYKPGMIPLPIPFETRLGRPLTLGRRPPLLPRPIILIKTVWSSALWLSRHRIFLGMERVLEIRNLNVPLIMITIVPIIVILFIIHHHHYHYHYLDNLDVFF